MSPMDGISLQIVAEVFLLYDRKALWSAPEIVDFDSVFHHEVQTSSLETGLVMIEFAHENLLCSSSIEQVWSLLIEHQQRLHEFRT